MLLGRGKRGDSLSRYFDDGISVLIGKTIRRKYFKATIGTMTIPLNILRQRKINPEAVVGMKFSLHRINKGLREIQPAKPKDKN